MTFKNFAQFTQNAATHPANLREFPTTWRAEMLVEPPKSVRRSSRAKFRRISVAENVRDSPKHYRGIEIGRRSPGSGADGPAQAGAGRSPARLRVRGAPPAQRVGRPPPKHPPCTKNSHLPSWLPLHARNMEPRVRPMDLAVCRPNARRTRSPNLLHALFLSGVYLAARLKEIGAR